MSADLEVNNILNGTQGDGSSRPWAFVHIRARTVFGNNKAQPFTRTINNAQVATTPSMADHLIGTAEQMAWRYVASDGNVYDFHDIILLLFESFLKNTKPADVAALTATAKTLRKWPAGYPGTPMYEQGQ